MIFSNSHKQRLPSLPWIESHPLHYKDFRLCLKNIAPHHECDFVDCAGIRVDFLQPARGLILRCTRLWLVWLCDVVDATGSQKVQDARKLIVAISLINLTSYKSMILFRYGIRHLHISSFKFQPNLGWCFATSSATALGSIFAHPKQSRIATPLWRMHNGYCSRI